MLHLPHKLNIILTQPSFLFFLLAIPEVDLLGVNDAKLRQLIVGMIRLQFDVNVDHIEEVFLVANNLFDGCHEVSLALEFTLLLLASLGLVPSGELLALRMPLLYKLEINNSGVRILLVRIAG